MEKPVLTGDLNPYFISIKEHQFYVGFLLQQLTEIREFFPLQKRKFLQKDKHSQLIKFTNGYLKIERLVIVAIWKTPANTNKQIKRISKNGTYLLKKEAGLYLRKKDNSLYFEGRIRFPFNKKGKRFLTNQEYLKKKFLLRKQKNKF